MKTAPITRELIQALPKSDLHLHLDGSLRLPTLIELAQRYQVKLPSFTEAGLRRAVFKGSYANLKEYLRGFAYTVSVLQHDSALEQAAFELAEDNQQEGVRYIEVRFAPQLHTSAGLNEQQALRAVNRGLQRAAQAFNRRAAVRSGAEPAFHYGIIVCAMRYFEEEYSKSLGRFIRAHAHAPMRDVYSLASLELARAAVRLVREEGLPIVGFDLAGREKGYPAADHWKAYDVAHENFLGKTVHAGEDYGPESIFQAITDLHAERLGHGTHLFATRAIRDPKITDRKAYVENLVEYIGDRRITLEVCPHQQHADHPPAEESEATPVRQDAPPPALRHPVHGQPPGLRHHHDRRGAKGRGRLPSQREANLRHSGLWLQAELLPRHVPGKTRVREGNPELHGRGADGPRGQTGRNSRDGRAVGSDRRKNLICRLFLELRPAPGRRGRTSLDNPGVLR